MSSKLDKDLNAFLNIYNNFEYDERSGKQLSMLSGEIDICGTDGDYWDSFNIEIYINKETYPFCIPIIIETSKRIVRHKDWHISSEGICCLDIHHELEYQCRKGINIVSFYQNKIYPYFANTVYKKREGHYANGEYLHDFGAVIEFYKKRLNLTNVKIIIELLDSIFKNTIPKRNDKCFCYSNLKYKKCHLKEVEILRSLPKERIVKDLKGFNEYVNK